MSDLPLFNVAKKIDPVDLPFRSYIRFNIPPKKIEKMEIIIDGLKMFSAEGPSLQSYLKHLEIETERMSCVCDECKKITKVDDMDQYIYDQTQIGPDYMEVFNYCKWCAYRHGWRKHMFCTKDDIFRPNFLDKD